VAAVNYEAEMSDEDLIEAYYGCDDLAFAELYRRYFPRLFAYFRRQGLSREDAQDLAEETFLRVVRTKRTGRGRFDRTIASFRTWLFSIARNLRNDHWQGLGIPPDEETEPEGETPSVEQVACDEPTPEEILAAKELLKPVHDCLAELPPGHRDALVLAIKGCPRRDMARILDIRYQTAATHLHRATQGIRVCLNLKGYRSVPHGSELVAFKRILFTFVDELLVELDMERLGREGYRFVPVGEVPPGARVVLAFPDVVLVRTGGQDPHQPEAQARDG
jgi:RNA polymerase sigma-70 factor (ECF subfamily)